MKKSAIWVLSLITLTKDWLFVSCVGETSNGDNHTSEGALLVSDVYDERCYTLRAKDLFARETNVTLDESHLAPYHTGLYDGEFREFRADNPGFEFPARPTRNAAEKITLRDHLKSKRTFECAKYFANRSDRGVRDQNPVKSYGIDDVIRGAREQEEETPAVSGRARPN